MANHFSRWIASLSPAHLAAISAQPNDREDRHGRVDRRAPSRGGACEGVPGAESRRNGRVGEGVGNPGAIQALADGKIDVALASHWTQHRRELSRLGIRGTQDSARIAVVFGVNAAVPVVNVTAQQVCDVVAAKFTNWRAVGGPDLRFRNVQRGPTPRWTLKLCGPTFGALSELRMPETVRR